MVAMQRVLLLMAFSGFVQSRPRSLLHHPPAARTDATTPPPEADAGSYTVVKQNAECLSRGQHLGSFGTMKQCADKCQRTSGCKYFIFGKRSKHGRCWWEKTATEKCHQGWERDDYDFAKIEPVSDDVQFHKQIEARRLSGQHAEQAKQDAAEAKQHGDDADGFSKLANDHRNAADKERQNAGALYGKASEHSGNAQRAMEAAKAAEAEQGQHYKKAAEHLKRANAHKTNAETAKAEYERLQSEAAEHGRISAEQKALAVKHHNSFKYNTQQMEKHLAKAQEYLDTKVIDVCLQLRKLAAVEAAKAQGFAEAANDSLKKHKQSQSKADSHNKSNIQKLKESVAQSQKAEEAKKLAAKANAKGDAANAKADQAGQDADNHNVAVKGHDDKSLDANNKGDAADKRAAAHDRKADAADDNAGKSRAAQQKASDASNVGGQAQTEPNISYSSRKLATKPIDIRAAISAQLQIAPTAGYCDVQKLTDLKDHSNHQLCKGGASKNIGQQFSISFQENQGANWKFYVYLDAGYGFHAFVDGKEVHKRTDDIWNGKDDRKIEIDLGPLKAGYHTFELYSGEACCDGDTKGEWMFTRDGGAQAIVNLPNLAAASPPSAVVTTAQTATAGGKGDCFTQDTNCKQLGAFCVHSASVDHCAPDCVEIEQGSVCAEYKGCTWDADVEMCDNDEAVHDSEIRKHKQGDANGAWLF